MRSNALLQLSRAQHWRQQQPRHHMARLRRLTRPQNRVQKSDGKVKTIVAALVVRRVLLERAVSPQRLVPLGVRNALALWHRHRQQPRSLSLRPDALAHAFRAQVVHDSSP
jgi:hypothetical protein